MKSPRRFFCSRECSDKWKSENITREKCNTWKGGVTKEENYKKRYDKKYHNINKNRIRKLRVKTEYREKNIREMRLMAWCNDNGIFLSNIKGKDREELLSLYEKYISARKTIITERGTNGKSRLCKFKRNYQRA